jgi:hypothetical protein
VRRSARPWWLALAGSLLLHGGLLGGLSWTLPQWPVSLLESPPIEARLVSLKSAVATPPPPIKPPSAKPVPPPARPRPAPPPEPPVEVAAAAAEPTAAADSVVDESTAPMPDEPARIEAAPENPPAVEAEATWPPLNTLPPRLDLRFQVHYGLATGEQTLVWIDEGEGYTITSVASASGLAGVFYRGRFVQTSRGRITPRGLQPEEFWDQRGTKHSSARFDVAQRTLTLEPAKGAPRHLSYQGDVQDVLSLFFQLALTAPPLDRQLAYTVFNGKKLRNYRYDVQGEDMLETALGTLRTLHLARAADGDGRFEIWLAVDRHYLPVRVLHSDDKGNEVELRIRSIAP